MLADKCIMYKNYPTWVTVPRREKKAFLQTHNLVVDAFVKRADDAASSAVFGSSR